MVFSKLNIAVTLTLKARFVRKAALKVIYYQRGMSDLQTFVETAIEERLRQILIVESIEIVVIVSIELINQVG